MMAIPPAETALKTTIRIRLEPRPVQGVPIPSTQHQQEVLLHLAVSMLWVQTFHFMLYLTKISFQEYYLLIYKCD